MKWTIIPTKTIIIRTQLSQEEVLQRVQTLLDTQDPKKVFHRFDGKVGQTDFEFWEIPRPRTNSFLPSSKGEILSDENGTFVRVVLRLNGCAFVFVLVWCYPLVLMLFLGALSFIRGGISELNWEAIGSVSFILFMLGSMITMTTLGFRSGVKSARAFLAEVFFNDE